MLVTDNGPAFTSTEFKELAKRNGIRHITSSPYHAASNGLAEHAVQTFKHAMKRSSNAKSLNTRISKFLLAYRLTPNSTIGHSPAEILLSRRPRSLLDLVRPDISSQVRKSQERQVHHHDQHSRSRGFTINEPVLVRNFSRGPPWLKGHVTQVRGPLSYQVLLQDSRTVRRHVDHLCQSVADSTGTASSGVDVDELDFTIILPAACDLHSPHTSVADSTEPHPSTDSTEPRPSAGSLEPCSLPASDTPESTTDTREHSPLLLRRSKRNRHPPDTFNSHLL